VSIVVKKIIIGITILFAVVVIVLTVLIKIYITPESIRAFIVPEAEKNLNRKVSLGEINISLFKGIIVKDFAIKERDKKADFLTCKEFVLAYRLLPLLKKQVVIKELKLISPSVNIMRDPAGKFNFEDMGQKKETIGKAGEKPSPEDKGLPVSLLVDNISIKDAQFSFQDMKKELPTIKGSLSLDTNIKSSKKSVIHSTGSLALKLDSVNMHKKTKKRIENIDVDIDYDIDFDVKSKSLTAERVNLTAQGITTKISGKVKNLSTSPEIDLALSFPKTSLASVQNALAPFADMQGIVLSGNMRADIKIKGKPKKPELLKTTGTVRLEKAEIKQKTLNILLDGSLKLKRDSVGINLKAASGKNSADLKGTVGSIFKNQKITLNVYSDFLNIDELIPASKNEKGKKSSEKKGTSAPVKSSKEATPINIKLTADGEIKVKTARYKKIDIQDFYARYVFKNNILKITKMTGITGTGTFNLTSKIDFSKPGYKYNLSSNLDSLHAEEVINSLFPKAKDTILGLFSFDLKMNGAGTQPEKFKKNLVADGTFTLKDGKIMRNKISDNLASFLGIEELKTILLTKADGTIKIRNGVAHLESLFLSDDISMDPAGTIGIIDEKLNLSFDLKLSPRLTDMALKNPAISSYIKDEQGWGRIPLIVSGTLSSPTYSVDVAKAGERIIKKKTKEFFEKLFEKDQQEQPEGAVPQEGQVQEQEKEPDLRKPIEDMFKRLFR
jgi:uncharacterized protein involved in outer membrane biogenesis